MFSAYTVSDENDDATTSSSSVSFEENVSDNIRSEVQKITFMSSCQFPGFNMLQLLGSDSNSMGESKNIQSMQNSSQDPKNIDSSTIPSQNIRIAPVPWMLPEMVDKEELSSFLQANTPETRGVSQVQEYVTPYADAVQDYLGDENLDDAEDIYEAAVSWIWVSDTILNGQQDAWLPPAEFLEDTPYFDSNPMPGEIVSDCSEQANTLASLLIGSGKYDESTVRVAIGEREFSTSTGGHAWVEVYEDGGWFPVDAVVGPYYDDDTSEIVYPDNYEDIDFYYYLDENYSAIEVWYYYNNEYFIDVDSGTVDAPDNWNSIPSSYS
ncbi:transglutaminase-like domain-containing protein [Methanolobus sp. ZRKC4]